MPSLPAAFALLAAGSALTGVAAATTDLRPGTGRPFSSTAATSAGPRRVAAVLPPGSPVGVPPGPAGGPAPTVPYVRPGTSLTTADPGTGFAYPLIGPMRVLRPFSPGPHPWSPGHRGVDLGTTGTPVLAAGAGRVSFAGSIAGRGVVVVEHAGVLRTTYEPVSPQVEVGRSVNRGDPIGSLQPGVGHCTPGACLHWGAKIGERYLDPLSLLGRTRRPPVLLPLDHPGG